MNWIMSVPLVLPNPCASRPNSLHMASKQTSCSFGTSMILEYFVMVLLVPYCTTPFAISLMLTGGMKVSAMSWRLRGVETPLDLENIVLPMTELKAC